jgi:putrescine transport system substrate-binding protein
MPDKRNTQGQEPAQLLNRKGGLYLLIALSTVAVAIWAIYLVIAPEPGEVSSRSVEETVDRELHNSSFVNVLGPTGSLADSLGQIFTDSNGLSILVTAYDTEDEALEQLRQRADGFDLIVVRGPKLKGLIAADAIQNLDPAQVENINNTSPALMERVLTYDPGNSHASIYSWGRTGLFMESEAVRTRLPPEIDQESWRIIFDPELVNRLSDCGVNWLDSSSSVFRAALIHLGLDPNSTRTQDYELAFRTLEVVQPHIGRLSRRALVARLVNEQSCLALIHSGDALHVMRLIEESGRSDADFAFILPEEGAMMWFDLMAVPSNAPMPNNGFKLMNFLLEPDIAAQITPDSLFAIPSTGSRLLIETGSVNDSAFSRRASDLPRVTVEDALPDDIRGLRDRLWALLSPANPQD